ncbi:MAG TPA: TetR/AcrR family transcriptional regulator [Candidatus Acidoferrum sp.]|jgi:TetR/AcrR family transcriptional repressor of nem operon|nr:TetR/AcrR family transcriptional regulator [Candidatus Acidoferrum sp.]
MGRTSSSQQLLLIGASDLLWEKSYHSVTVDEVCARAGVLKGSLYHFFDSKSALALSALQHLWETVAKRAYEEHFSRANPPLARISSFLNWLQGLQRKKFRTMGRVLGWPFFTLGCELGAQEPTISERLRQIEEAELFYFESALHDALDQDIIEPADPRAEALALRAAVEGILARARILIDPAELRPLAVLPITILWLKPPGEAVPFSAYQESEESIALYGS